jgi:hypothetical protein
MAGSESGHGGFEVGSRPARGQTHCRHGPGQIHGVARSVGLAGSFVAVGLFLVWVFLILIWCG